MKINKAREILGPDFSSIDNETLESLIKVMEGVCRMVIMERNLDIDKNQDCTSNLENKVSKEGIN